MEILTELQPWHWLVLCFLLLGMEALGAEGFLLGAAVSAVFQAFVLWLIPEMAWTWQLSCFGVATMVFTIAWWVLFWKPGQNSEEPLLNNRAAQMVGRVVTLEQDLVGGTGRIQIGDTKWKVQADSSFKAGTTVVVTKAEGMILHITKHHMD